MAETEIGAVIIGDELLSGKRRDRHQAALIAALAERGLELAWVRIVGDDAGLLTATFRETTRRDAWVFSFGGIGATPDDRTRACLARALGRPLVRHPEFVALLEGRFGAEAYPNRVLMADLPGGGGLIPNPVNGVPGFHCERHFCVPGFPVMAEPMARWVLAEYLARLAPAQAPVERSLRVHGIPESRLVPLLNDFEARYPELRISSLPGSVGDVPRVELGVRGAPAPVAAAFEELRQALVAGGLVAGEHEIEWLSGGTPPSV
ncbi:Molybdopterin-binding protein [Thioalkalivibrio nitratireducens DSM 14787]|uniref:Molybdopterin-binding protein n=1 Tax=Thioalkalivibrio nitratireducens (strain DSM 14787 / UNIQEM 213 / ALEN2) TaxID=1255043 RepID=L0E1Q7_THIND|nr:Molybdopterin-binding protein [Thioalkalivibrio nitratireducens DSM 14787]